MLREGKTKTLFHLKVAAIWLLVLLLTIPLIHLSIRTSIREKKKDAELVLHSESGKIQNAISSRLANLYTMEALIRYAGGMIDGFEEQAENIFERDPCIRCIQLAPNGVITHIYPIEGNENAFGNLFVNNIRRDEAIYARDSGEMTLGGPYALHQGGTGVVARHPIFLDTDDGDEIFWGFAIQVMDLPVLLQIAEIDKLTASGYTYRLWRYEPRTNAPTVFAGIEGELPDSPLTEQILVPGGAWFLSLVPTDGWVSDRLQISSLLIFLIVNLLTAALAWGYIRLNNSKEQLETISNIDDLTGLYNYRRFYSTLQQLEQQKEPFFLYYLDLNKFKPVNDAYGHTTGNRLLCSLSQRITELTKDQAIPFRIGGDEFAVIRPGSDPAEMEALRQKLIQQLNQPFKIKHYVLNNTVSCGCVAYPRESDRIDQLLDLADQRMYEEKARHSASAVLNSRDAFFKALLAKLLEERELNTEQAFYFYHIDYKNFKLFNYTYGIKAGNALVDRSVSFINSLQECLLCSRGFADRIFFATKEPASMNLDDVMARFEQYYSAFFQKEQEKFPDVMLACNCGVSLIEGSDLENAAGRANIGRLIAKQRHTIKPIFVDPQTAKDWMSRCYSESRILLAARKKQFYYELQPILHISEKTLVCAEALGRIEDTNGTSIPPKQFVPILTESGDIVSFDLAILELVCRDLRSRLETGKPVVPIHIHMSSLLLEVQQAPKLIQQRLLRYDIAPSLICIEITEELMLKNLQKAESFCKAMHELGVRVALDDFGAGGLNLEALKRLPIDILMLGRSPIAGGSRIKSYFLELLSVSGELSLPVIIKNVETEEQHRWLLSQGIDLAHGYYYGEPDSPETIYKHLQKNVQP